MYIVDRIYLVLEISNAKIKHSILATVCYLLHCYGTIHVDKRLHHLAQLTLADSVIKLNVHYI